MLYSCNLTWFYHIWPALSTTGRFGTKEKNGTSSLHHGSSRLHSDLSRLHNDLSALHNDLRRLHRDLSLLHKAQDTLPPCFRRAGLDKARPMGYN